MSQIFHREELVWPSVAKACRDIRATRIDLQELRHRPGIRRMLANVANREPFRLADQFGPEQVAEVSWSLKTGQMAWLWI